MHVGIDEQYSRFLAYVDATQIIPYYFSSCD